MLNSLYISAIGLQAQKEQLDSVASNLANLGTTAFKRQSVDFSAILDRVPLARGTDAISAQAAHPNRLYRTDLAPGEVHATGRPLDVAIIGAGFFEIELPDERTGYSRVGALQIDSDGEVSLANGRILKADIRVPSGASGVQILPDGAVLATLPGDAEPTVLGQIELARFDNPELLEYRGEGVFTAPEGIEPTRARPGEEGTEPLAVASLEGSNVQITDEMVSLMLMQRIYELNSRVAQVTDEIIGMSNNLRRN